MKKMMIVMVSLVVTQLLRAQGMIYLSSIGTSTGNAAVGSDSWLAALFITGNNTAGYALDSVQLAIADATGNPNGFTVAIYSSIIGGDVLPGSSLGTLDGSDNPSTAAIYIYAPDTDITLSPSTTYFIMATAGTAVATGAYEWSESAYPPNVSNGWVEGNGILYFDDNDSHWYTTPYLGIAQFAITATPIPEPSASWLFLLGSGVFIYVRRTFHR